jgi:dipeptidase E
MKKYLLTSAGIKNPSIHDALVDLLGKPIGESSALVIPTAIYPFPGGAGMAAQLIRGVAKSPLCELGWRSLGVLELSALPSIERDRWVPMLQETDALLVGGGDPLYLYYWMRQSGLADILPSLRPATVYVGVSAGSVVMAPNVGEEFVDWKPPSGGDRTLGLVDFALFPHLDNPRMPDMSLANAEKWAAALGCPAYAIDDETAIQVVDGAVKVVSEGHWKLFT